MHKITVLLIYHKLPFKKNTDMIAILAISIEVCQHNIINFTHSLGLLTLNQRSEKTNFLSPTKSACLITIINFSFLLSAYRFIKNKKRKLEGLMLICLCVFKLLHYLTYPCLLCANKL